MATRKNWGKFEAEKRGGSDSSSAQSTTGGADVRDLIHKSQKTFRFVVLLCKKKKKKI